MNINYMNINYMNRCLYQYQMTLSSEHLKSCEQFIRKIENTDTYSKVREILINWQRESKSIPGAISSFKSIADVIRQKQAYIEDFNKCLVKEAIIPLKIHKQKQLVRENTQRPNEFRPIFKQPELNLRTNSNTNQLIKGGQLTQSEMLQRIQSNKYCTFIIRIIHLFMKCIIGRSQFKQILSPVSKNDPKLYHYLRVLADQTETKRRKQTVFAPLHELVDQKYPMDQIGNSYIRIPDGYANYGKHWSVNKLQSALNRKYVSVPLGQEASFKIGRKNQFQQILIQSESQKYQIDLVVSIIKNCISLIKKKKIDSSLVKSTVVKIYQNDSFYNLAKDHPEIGEKILLGRLQQKLGELERAKIKFQKICLDIASKNFQKSLDHRCYYFRKNDKKFNGQPRFQTQIQLRHEQLEGKHQGAQEIQDRESLHKPRHITINTFDNITKEKFIEDIQVSLNYPRKIQSIFPKFPKNQIIFICNFSDTELLYDVLEILLYHSSKKILLELMIFKLFGIIIPKRLTKNTHILKLLEYNKVNSESHDHQNGVHNQLLNDKKDRKIYKDFHEQFNILIEQEPEPTHFQHIESPFEGPDDHTLICTKSCYFFVRFLLTIYQRFQRAKQISKQKINQEEAADVYVTFITILIYKLKDPKFNDYLRNVFGKDAFIFLTVDKLMTNVFKILNNMNQDSLTYKILKQGTKDYQMEIKKWEDYQFPSTYEQLVRLSQVQQTLFRFTFVNKQANIYISAYENTHYDSSEAPNFNKYIIEPFPKKSKANLSDKTTNNVYVDNKKSEYMTIPGTYNLIMKGESLIVGKRQKSDDTSRIQLQLSRVRKLIKLN